MTDIDYYKWNKIPGNIDELTPPGFQCIVAAWVDNKRDRYNIAIATHDYGHFLFVPTKSKKWFGQDGRRLKFKPTHFRFINAKGMQ